MPMILDESRSASPSSSPNLDDAALRRSEHHTADVVIVGAGVLGTSMAVALARQSRSVILLEKSLKEPDRIVGELLQPGGIESLDQLGLLDCLEGIDAISEEGYQVIYYGKPVTISYPPEARSNGKKPEGVSFHHGRFIRKLREAAMKEPNITLVESTVTDLCKNDHTDQVLGVQCLTQGEKDCYFGDLTVIADGYASKFRKQYLPHTPVAKSKFWALELRDCKLPKQKYAQVVLGDHAPILLYQIGTHETRILVDIPENTPKASVANGGVKGYMNNVVLPSLPESVRPSFEEALEGGKLRSMPNSWLPPSTNRSSGMVILGDAMNMRHPLTGGGMTVAFNDVVVFRDLLSPEKVPDLTNTQLVRKQMQAFHWQRKNLCSVINILAQALYSLFAADDPQLKALQLGCFRYFELGGNCIDGPVGLLGGIIRQPLVLFYHFFAVAFLAMWVMLTSAPIWQLPLTIVRCFMVFWKACVVIFPFIWSEAKA